jgi:hypothetical protein
MTRALCSHVVVAALSCPVVLVGGGTAAYAQSSNSFDPVKSGDCVVRVTVPNEPEVNFGSVRLFRDETETDVQPHTARLQAETTTLEFHLRQPVIMGSQLTVRYWTARGAEAPPIDYTVRRLGLGRESCKAWDERGNFEPTVFYGVGTDTFAPNENAKYPPGTTYPLKASQAVRLDGQLRVAGTRERWLDKLWLEVEAEYGERAADLDCTTDAGLQSPLCSANNSAFQVAKNAGAAVTSAVLRASRVEAVFKPRFELFTLNKGAEVPVTFFLSGRAGLTQFPDDIKPANQFSAGAGFLFPGGSYRDSGFTYFFGENQNFRTHPHGGRSKMDFKFIFNTLPGLKDQIPFLPRASKSVRGLIQVTVDRNFFGPGPDTLQTYLGLVMDFGQLLGNN